MDASRALVAAVVSFYFVVSIAQVFVNKVVLSASQALFTSSSASASASAAAAAAAAAASAAASSSSSDAFPYPITVTWLQLVVALLIMWLSAPLRSLRSASASAARSASARAPPPPSSSSSLLRSMVPPVHVSATEAVHVLPLSVVFVAMLLAGNYCLQFVEAAFYQVARSLHILFSVLLTRALIGETPAKRVMLACAIVFAGYVISSAGELRWNVAGAVAGVLASFLTAANSIAVSRTLPAVKHDSQRLLYVNTLMSTVLLGITAYATGEGAAAMHAARSLSTAAIVRIVASGVVGYLLNVASFLQIRYTSPLTHMISGTAKGAVQTILGVALFASPFTMANGVGLAAVLGGSFLYAYFRHKINEANRKK